MQLTVSLPWPDRRLSPNARQHYMARARMAKSYRQICALMAIENGWRRIDADHLAVTVTFHPPDKRRRDRDNMIASFKSGADGIADVLGVDDSRWIPTYLVGDPVPAGAVVFSVLAV